MDRGPEAILARLRASPLFAPDFPRRPRHTIAAWAALPEAERRAFDAAAGEAMGRARQICRPLQNDVHALGVARYAPAVPVLAALWHDCALEPVRTGAGHALLRIGDAAAYDALEALIDDRRPSSTHLALNAAFRRDPPAAYARLAPLFEAWDETSIAIAQEVLSLLSPPLFARDGTPLWERNDVPGWLARDGRWITLCAALLRDDRHAAAARAVLRYADPAAVLPALDAARARMPPPAAPTTRGSGDLARRYAAGDHLGAWREARACGAIAGELRAEVAALAELTMLRVARNIDQLAERLRREGWRTPLPMRTLPEPDDAARVAAIEAMTGAALPPSLAAFWRIVGGVCLSFDREAGGADEVILVAGLPLARLDTDALWVDPCAAFASLEDWKEQKDAIHPDLVGPFALDLAPDRLHKGNVSGGPPYAVELPFAGADPAFRQEHGAPPFVDYLRDCFRFAGFPHLRRHPDGEAVRRFSNELGRGLEPF